MKTTLTNQELVEKCKALISALCKNPSAWTMPVDVNNDSDVILSELCNRFEDLNDFQFMTLAKAAPSALWELFILVATESDRAKAKFGEQLEIPSIEKAYADDPIELKGFYEIPSESRAKFMTDTAMKKKELTWGHIAVEELAEVIGCKDDQTRRVELIQLMSVCARWIAAIDYQTNKK